MALEDKQLKTISYYDNHADKWAKEHGGYEEKSFWEEEIQKFKELLPSGKVLEIGSGTGKDASALIKMGYQYIGTDASKELLEIAQERNPGARFVHRSVENLDFPENNFDGFWIAATLLHIPKEKIDGVLRVIHKQIKSGGVGFISVKQGKGEKEDEETGRWFAYYSEDEFRKLFESNNYKVIESRIKPTEKNTWLIFFVKVQK